MSKYCDVEILVVNHSRNEKVPSNIEQYLTESNRFLIAEAPSPPAESHFPEVIRSTGEDDYSRFFNDFADKWGDEIDYLRLVGQQTKMHKDVVLVAVKGIVKAWKEFMDLEDLDKKKNSEYVQLEKIKAREIFEICKERESVDVICGSYIAWSVQSLLENSKKDFHVWDYNISSEMRSVLKY